MKQTVTIPVKTNCLIHVSLGVARKAKLVVLLACGLWLFSSRTAVCGPIYEYDFNPGVGSISINGYLLLDAPSGDSGTAADILSWDLTADGLNWTPSSSYVAPVTLDNNLTWDNSSITSLSIQLVAYTSAPWYDTEMWGPQLLTLWESGVSDGAGGGLTPGAWVGAQSLSPTFVPEPSTVALLFELVLFIGGYCRLRGYRFQPNKR
ncbi:MAG TPA: hypothetical protein VG077_15390 [Verrucomicrobiae bacterium]|nr:hypothetical protein [Verrucomicrobiae bacterium]